MRELDGVEGILSGVGLRSAEFDVGGVGIGLSSTTPPTAIAAPADAPSAAPVSIIPASMTELNGPRGLAMVLRTRRTPF